MALHAPAALTAACSGALPASLRCRARCARPRGAALRVVASHGNTPERESLYETLGVAPGASAEAVKRAFRRLALRCAASACVWECQRAAGALHCGVRCACV
jgi:hypothetical protein